MSKLKYCFAMVCLMLVYPAVLAGLDLYIREARKPIPRWLSVGVVCAFGAACIITSILFLAPKLRKQQARALTS